MLYAGIMTTYSNISELLAELQQHNLAERTLRDVARAAHLNANGRWVLARREHLSVHLKC